MFQQLISFVGIKTKRVGELCRQSRSEGFQSPTAIAVGLIRENPREVFTTFPDFPSDVLKSSVREMPLEQSRHGGSMCSGFGCNLVESHFAEM
jgi:hypothetical protein